MSSFLFPFAVLPCWNTEKCFGVESGGQLRKTAHTCFHPFNDSAPFGAPIGGTGSGLYRRLIQTGEDSGIVTHLEGAGDTWLTL